MEICKKCKSKKIVWMEFMWAYDWVLMLKCEDCWYMEHRESWKEIISYKQKKEYWPVTFIVKGKDWKETYINRYKKEKKISFMRNWKTESVSEYNFWEMLWVSMWKSWLWEHMKNADK